MRRPLALACGSVYMAFFLLAGQVHVHLSPGHHEEARGLHFAHDHMGGEAEGDHQRGHSHDSSRGSGGNGEVGLDGRDADPHHGDDAVYLSEASARAAEKSRNATPAIASSGAVIGPPSGATDRSDGARGGPRDPPGTVPPRLRSPPA